MEELNRYREAFLNLPGQIQEAEVQAEKNILSEATVSGGVSKGMGFSEKTELFVRASGEKTGMVYTENLSEDPQEILRLAFENSLMGETKEPMNTREEVEEGSKAAGELGKTEECCETETKVLHDFACRIETELREQFSDAGRIEVGAVQKLTMMGIVNTKGVDVSATTGHFDVTVEVSHRDDPLKIYTETRSAKQLSQIGAEAFLENLKNWELTVRGSGKFIPGTYRAVLSSQVVNFLLVTGWQMFSGVHYQSGRSALCGKLGEKVFSECITIRDKKGRTDCGIPSGYTFLIDAEGTPCKDVNVVEKGIFKGLLHNLSTAHKAGTSSTGNAGRKALLSGNIHTDMTVIPGNLMIEAGENTLAQLLSKCENGIYIYEAYDQFHGLNTVTGDFMFPCKGILVEDGQLKAGVSGLSMNGNIVELFQSVEALGREQKIEPMIMYNNYVVSGPSMLVSNLRVSG